MNKKQKREIFLTTSCLINVTGALHNEVFEMSLLGTETTWILQNTCIDYEQPKKNIIYVLQGYRLNMQILTKTLGLIYCVIEPLDCKCIPSFPNRAIIILIGIYTINKKNNLMTPEDQCKHGNDNIEPGRKLYFMIKTCGTTRVSLIEQSPWHWKNARSPPYFVYLLTNLHWEGLASKTKITHTTKDGKVLDNVC